MFASYINQFSDNLDALRDFVELIAPFLSEKGTEQTKKDAKSFMPLILAAYKLKIPSLPLEEIDPTILNRISQELGGDVEIEIVKDTPNEKSANIKTRGTISRRFGEALRNLELRNYREDLLYRSSLISLVSAAEWFLSQILHLYFQKFPDASGIHDKSLTYAELQYLGSIEDAKTYLIDSKVEGVLRDSFREWLDFLKSRLNLSLGYVEPDKNRLVEVCLRRNLLVHNGGIVNTTYLSRVPSDVKENVELNDSINVPRAYLDDAIARCERCFILIAAEPWKQLEPNDEARPSLLLDIAYRHLRAERWGVSENLSHFMMNDKKNSERSRILGTLNYWLSLKEQGRFDDVRKEVEVADFSAKDEVFVLGKLALLDEESQFFKLLEECLKTGKVSHDNVEEWPIFRTMRNTDSYRKKYLKNSDDAPSQDS